MNLVDLAAAVIVLLAAALGYRIGLVRQLGGLLGATLGIGLVILAIQSLSAELAQLGDLGRVLGVVAALLVAGFAGQAIGSQIGSRIASGNEEGFGGTTNRWAGALLGGAEGVVLVWLLSSLITVVPDPGLARMAQKSTTVQTLTEIAPAPAALAQQFTDSLAGVDVGLLFDGVIPQPAAPSKLPANARVRQVAQKAEPSVVKVVRTGCGLQGVGSGAVIANGYVITNAHVIRGGTWIQVEKDGRRYDATPVRMDRKLDAALLFVPELIAPALKWTTVDPTRSDQGAVLGYPGGGPFTAGAASVSRDITAVGRDISGSSSVSRQVLELRAKVEPGNSGGPMVLLDGTIGGLVFAESPDNPRVGYALAPSDVTSSINPAIGRTTAVGTGSC
jgi:S1-C subfamily serine protease